MSSNPTEQHSSAGESARLMRMATIASVATALLLISAKLFAYLQTGAVSILASLLDSLMDAVTSLVNFFAVRYALMPADHNHRFGHGKAESLAALFQAPFIIATSGFLVYEAVHRLLAPEPITAIRYGVYVMLLAIVVTAALVVFQLQVIRKTDSTAIKADSLHYRADVLSNAATLLAIVLANQGFTRADPILALGIAGYLLISTRAILGQAFNELLDRELPGAQRQVILEIATGHPAVHGVHDLRTRRSGRTPIVQMHIELDGNLSLRESHTIADAVEAAIHQRYPDADVVIHQDPKGLNEEPRWQQSE
jgi:ferrous-iron efflux pump FieF